MPPAFSPLHLLAPLLLMLSGIGMASLWLRWRERKELVWMALSFVSCGCGLLVQVMQVPSHLFLFVMGFSCCYLMGAGAMATSLALRMSVGMPWKTAVGMAAVLLGLQTWYSAVDPNTAMRVYLFSVGAMLVMGLPLVYWKSMHIHSRFDTALRWVFVGCIALNLVRPLLLMPSAQGVEQEALALTGYWMALHFSALLTVPVLAATMIAAVLWDVIGQLQQERNVDGLTQLLNRRGFEEKLRHSRRAAQAGRWSLLLCDLDHFKRINDTWGHAIGDQALVEVARALRQHVRAGDVFARYGGEEFVVLLANADRHTAQCVAERMRTHLANQPMDILQGQSVTVSIGVAELASLAPEALALGLKQADAQMYTAKRAGRNRVAIETM